MTQVDHVPRIRGRSLETQQLRAQHARILTLEVLSKPVAEWASEREDTTIGNEQRLRGIPVVGRGVGGTSPGTNPLAETLKRSR